MLVSCMLSLSSVFAADYPLYVRFIPYNPPNLHLQTARASNAYYIPNVTPGTTYLFRLNPALSSQLSLAEGVLPITLQFYNGLSACRGQKVITVTVKYNISGNFVTLGSQTQSINVTSGGSILKTLNFNGIAAGQRYILQSGDYIQLEMKHESSGTGDACLVNEFPLGGSDADTSKIVLQTGPILSLKKTESLLSDPYNGTANPKRIPGAVVRYRLQVSNDPSASAAGENVVINDTIPTNTQYKANSITLNGVPQTDATGDDAGEYNGTAIKVDTGILNPGDAAAIEYDITVN